VNEGCWVISGDEKLSLAGTTGDGGEMCAEVAQSFAVSRQIRVSRQGPQQSLLVRLRIVLLDPLDQ
jgi:hypothetical protein